MIDRERIFRKVSLDRLSSPEQLDMLVQVITPRAWLVWLPLVGIVIAAIAWGFIGIIPTVVAGRAILLQPGGLADVSSSAQGRVVEIGVGIGAQVTKGQVIARIAQPELVERLRLAQDRLAELQRQESRLKNLLAQGVSLSEAGLNQQRATLTQQVAAAEERMHLFEERIVSQGILLEQGLITKQTLLATRNDLNGTRLEAETLRGQIQQLALKKLETRKQAESEMSQIQSQVGEARRALEGLSDSARLSTVVESPYAGRVVEVKVAQGALVSPGMPLVTIEPKGGESGALEAAIYLSAAEGKKVATGMRVQISPSTVKREEYGYLIGEVIFVSDYPSTAQSMRATLQNDELVRELSGTSPPIEIRAKLIPAGNVSGYQWSSPQGPPLKITAGTLARAEIVVRRQPPISLMIPALRQTLGAR